MYAIIETGGKQVKVEQGQASSSKSSTWKPVTKLSSTRSVCWSATTAKIGTPYVEGAKVTCKVEKQGKEKKIHIFKYKAKKGSTRRRQGHRQPYTKLTIESIEG